MQVAFLHFNNKWLISSADCLAEREASRSKMVASASASIASPFSKKNLRPTSETLCFYRNSLTGETLVFQASAVGSSRISRSAFSLINARLKATFCHLARNTLKDSDLRGYTWVPLYTSSQKQNSQQLQILMSKPLPSTKLAPPHEEISLAALLVSMKGYCEASGGTLNPTRYYIQYSLTNKQTNKQTNNNRLPVDV